jgi:type I restriction enzyme M protein
MAIMLLHGVLFRGGAEDRIRIKLLKDGHIDTVIGLHSNLFFSPGIPVCILVLEKYKQIDVVLFINASKYFEKGKLQNRLRDGKDGQPDDIQKIVETCQFRKQDDIRYSRVFLWQRLRKKILI